MGTMMKSNRGRILLGIAAFVFFAGLMFFISQSTAPSSEQQQTAVVPTETPRATTFSLTSTRVPTSPTPRPTQVPATSTLMPSATQYVVTATPQPEVIIVTATPQPEIIVVTATPSAPTISGQGNGPINFSGVPDVGHPYRVATVYGPYSDYSMFECNMALPFCNVVATKGVYGVSTYDETLTNESAVFMAPDTQELLENATGTLICPETGYMMASFSEATLTFDDPSIEGEQLVTLRFNDQGQEHMHLVIIRCLDKGGGGLSIDFSDYVRGATFVTMLDSHPDFSAFFSEGFLEQNMVHGLTQTPNSTLNGGEGAERLTLTTFDVSSLTYAVGETTTGLVAEVRLTQTNMTFR